MERDLQLMADRTFDVVVVGGGALGLAVAWDAALRGLSTALVEQGDFCSGTSANSLKLIHGGLRYLQHADLKRLRQSVRERRFFLARAPHLVHPLPFLIPTYGHGAKSREAMNIAFLLYGLLSADRNEGVPTEGRIPLGRTVSASQCREYFPGFESRGLTGGAIFYDGQAHNLERLTLLFALAASRAGALLANHAEVTGFLGDSERVTGVKVRDRLTGGDLEIRASLVVNAAGPWADRLLSRLTGRKPGGEILLAKAVNIVSRKVISPTFAVGLESREVEAGSLVKRGGRLFFITPWRGVNLIGTTYHTYRDDPNLLAVNEGDIAELVDGINGAWPGAGLRREDITFHHLGLVPIDEETGPGVLKLTKSDRVTDHERTGGPAGLITAVGVKYTTARDVAAEVIDLAFRRLARLPLPCRSGKTALPGGEMESFKSLLRDAEARRPEGMAPPVMEHLARSYGSEFPMVLAYVAEKPELGKTIPGSEEVIGAEVVHSVRVEMARALADVIFRRTDLGTKGHPGREALEACARLMSAELGWDENRSRREIEAVDAGYRPGP